MFRNLLAFVVRWFAYCQVCMIRTDQELHDDYAICLNCQHKLDKTGRLLE